MNRIFKVVASIAIAGVTAVSTLSVASADAIADRQAKMKTVGKSMGVVGKMAKGANAFDAQAALAALIAMKEAAQDFETLFPDGSGEGNTEAAPAIFTDRAGFDAKNVAFRATLDKVSAGAPADLAALQMSVGELGQSCGGCHKAYRVKKN